MPTLPDGLLDRIQTFLDGASEEWEEWPPLALMHLGDIELLVAIVRAGTKDEDDPTLFKEFLESAERGVRGWKRANTQQIGTIGRLERELRSTRADLSAASSEIMRLNEKLGVAAKEADLDRKRRVELRRLMEEWRSRGPVTGSMIDIVNQYLHRIRLLIGDN